MPRRVSATEAKVRLGEMMAWATDTDDDVIIESHGKPKAVLLSFAEYQRVIDVRARLDRDEALAMLNALQERVSQRNSDLSVDDAMSLADRAARDVAGELAFTQRIAEDTTDYDAD